MVCILSQAYCEDSTEEVMAWLRANGIPHIRINAEDIRRNALTLSIERSASAIALHIDGQAIALHEVTSVWLRKWSTTALRRKPDVFSSPSDETFTNLSAVEAHLRRETKALSEHLSRRLSNVPWLGSFTSMSCNKLDVLQEAARLGLDIPDSLVTSDTAAASAFAAKHKKIITKPLSEVLICETDECLYMTYTSEISPREEWSGGTPSLFQERLDKHFEIRSFYIDGQFFHAALFSQDSLATVTDFRVYQPGAPTRTVPFRMPQNVEILLDQLMRHLKLRTGSIDIVKTHDGRYVFLEVNPVGQYGLIAGPCNFPISEMIAHVLAGRENNDEPISQFSTESEHRPAL